jgi:hypothetical protein
MINMRHVIVMLVLTAALAVPAYAQSARLPYALTISGTSAAGTITGAWGGLPVQGTYSGGRWAIVSGGKPVAGGTYRCNGGCTFEGTVTYNTPTRFSLAARGLGDTGTASVSGSLPINLAPRSVK